MSNRSVSLAVAVTSFALTSLALAACVTRPLGRWSSGDDPDSGVPRDGQVHVDAEPLPDAALTCTTDHSLRLERHPLASLWLLNGDPILEGLTVRVSADMILPACYVMAQVTARVDPSTCEVVLAGWAWHKLGQDLDCSNDEPYTDQEIIALTGLHSCSWTVREEPMSGTTSQALLFRVATCPGDWDCFCAGEPYQGRADYDDCNRECECASGQCIVGYSLIGEVKVCGRSCSLDVDCQPWESCMFAMDGPYGQCTEGELSPHCPDITCVPGYSCLEGPSGGYCTPAFDIRRTGEICTCDDTCGFGLRCVDLGYGESAFCALPCRGQSACPAGSACGDQLDTGEAPVCLLLMDLH